MNLIDKIEIRYFRSLYHVEVKQIKDLNILTGKNDAGKSNVLRALNLFFNGATDIKLLDFGHDFNKQRSNEVKLESIRGKQFIQIKVTFNRVGSFENTLPPKFTVTKNWRKDGSVDVSDDIKFLIEKSGKKYGDRNKTSLTKFINKIKYFYVPAIKDKHIFQNLLLDLRDILYETILKKYKNINDSLKMLNEAVSEPASELNREYRRVMGVETELSTSKSLDELFQALHINTKYKNYDIPLDYRGDGIRVRYLPNILDYIAKNSPFFCIWGFEEPENSLEYASASNMAKLFFNEYLKRTQIFITTHSIAFFNISESRSQLFRCFNSESGHGTEIKIYDEARNNLMYDKEIGQFEILKELQFEFENKITLLEEKNAMLQKIEDELKNMQKPLLLTEGKTDVAILTKAWDALYNDEMPFSIKSCDIYSPEHRTSAAGAGQLKKQLCGIRHDNINQMVIGLFDRDDEGKKEFSLDNNFVETSIDCVKKHRNNKAYAILLPSVVGLENFAEYDNLFIEFYFDKKYLEKEINGIRLKLTPESIETKMRNKVIKKEMGTELYQHKIAADTKKFFAEKIVPTFEKEAFLNFETLFEIILKIIKGNIIEK